MAAAIAGGHNPSDEGFPEGRARVTQMDRAFKAAFQKCLDNARDGWRDKDKSSLSKLLEGAAVTQLVEETLAKVISYSRNEAADIGREHGVFEQLDKLDAASDQARAERGETAEPAPADEMPLAVVRGLQLEYLQREEAALTAEVEKLEAGNQELKSELETMQQHATDNVGQLGQRVKEMEEKVMSRVDAFVESDEEQEAAEGEEP